MRHGIKEFRPRRPLQEQLGAATLNRILRELESLRITRVNGGSFRKLPSGTEISVGRSTSQGSGTSSGPWDIKASPDPDVVGKYNITVVPGTVNNVLPSNWDAEFEIVGSALHYAKAVCTTDNRQVTSVEIVIDDEVNDPPGHALEGVPSTVEVLFGLVLNGVPYRVIDAGHITLAAYQAAVVASGGEGAPYDVYYTMIPA